MAESYEVTFVYSMTEKIVVEAASAVHAIERAATLSPEHRNPDRYPVSDVSARKLPNA